MTVEPKEVYCSCCRQEREKSGQSPRDRLPVLFDPDKDPVLICEFCDGDALPLARSTSEARESGE